MGALPTAPRTARAHVSDVLGGWRAPRFQDDAVLIASELVTNVVRQCHDGSGRPVYIGGRLPVVQQSMFSDRTSLLIPAYEQAPGIPHERTPDDSAQTRPAPAPSSTPGPAGAYPRRGAQSLPTPP